jgi:hypothetical protein
VTHIMAIKATPKGIASNHDPSTNFTHVQKIAHERISK